MATTNTIEDVARRPSIAHACDLLIAVAGPVRDDDFRHRSTEVLRSMDASALRTAFAYPVGSAAEAEQVASTADGPLVLTYVLSNASAPPLPWLAVPAAYNEIARLAESTGARACIILSQDLGAFTGHALGTLLRPLLDGKALLSIPRYPTGKYEGLLNSAIFYPFTRALYGKQVRYPLAQDFGVAGAMIAKLAAEIQRNRTQSGLWPVVEGAMADVPIAQGYLDVRHVLQGDSVELSKVLSTLAGSIFDDAETKAAHWQRVRGSHPTSTYGTPAQEIVDAQEVDVRRLIESFNLGLRNLQEVWGLVLPPVTLLELKRMARLPVEQFRLPDAVWARIIYDFALAYRLRTISRTHLLGALTPLYLGWVASHAAEMRTVDGRAAEERVERLAVAFEEAKPYFVSRWRWPDRFNP